MNNEYEVYDGRVGWGSTQDLIGTLRGCQPRDLIRLLPENFPGYMTYTVVYPNGTTIVFEYIEGSVTATRVEG